MPLEWPKATLRIADQGALEQALAHALQFDGRRQFKVSGEMMAKITAAHLAELLRRAGFVVMQRPTAAAHTAPSTGYVEPVAYTRTTVIRVIDPQGGPPYDR